MLIGQFNDAIAARTRVASLLGAFAVAGVVPSAFVVTVPFRFVGEEP